jgi:hypothetical protein
MSGNRVRASRFVAVAAAGPLLALLSSAGCRPEFTFTPVRGRVTLKDGTPVTRGIVTFFPDKANKLQLSPNGRIGPDGTYEVNTANKSGVPVGSYVVGIRTGPGGGDDPPAPFSGKYFTADSPLKLEVVAEPAPGAYDFVLDPAKNRGGDRAD